MANLHRKIPGKLPLVAETQMENHPLCRSHRSHAHDGGEKTDDDHDHLTAPLYHIGRIADAFFL